MMCKGPYVAEAAWPRTHLFSCYCLSDICWPVATDKVALGFCQYDTENTRFPCVSLQWRLEMHGFLFSSCLACVLADKKPSCR